METQGNAKMKIYNLIILDKSGSMASIRRAAIDGVNETINGIRQAQKKYADTQEHFLTLRVFCDCEQRDVYDCVPITDVKNLTEGDYQPCCCTPLYDAMGFSLTKLKGILGSGSNSTAVVTVVTDGLENSSKEFNGPQVAQLVKELREQGWVFAYMGSDHDVEAVASQMNIQNVQRFEHTDEGTGASFERESNSRTRLFDRIDCCMSAAPNMSAESFHASLRIMDAEFYDEDDDTEIFVFGSNTKGTHDGGAARNAVLHHGAIKGQAEGRQGNAYAIPTVGNSRQEMAEAIERFCIYALTHPDNTFNVTAIGCGHAGYTPADIAPLFERVKDAKNVNLPTEFTQILNK